MSSVLKDFKVDTYELNFMTDMIESAQQSGEKTVEVSIDSEVVLLIRPVSSHIKMDHGFI